MTEAEQQKIIIEMDKTFNRVIEAILVGSNCCDIPLEVSFGVGELHTYFKILHPEAETLKEKSS